jgi:hypothetical protein
MLKFSASEIRRQEVPLKKGDRNDSIRRRVTESAEWYLFFLLILQKYSGGGQAGGEEYSE